MNLQKKNIKIAIVGAGLSGLTAAYRLQQQGYEVHTYEARPRVGGRILSVKIGESCEELGGKSFLDGGDAKHSLGLIKELNLELLKYQTPFLRGYVGNGSIIPYDKILRKFKTPDNLWREVKNAAGKSLDLQHVINSVFTDSPELRVMFTTAMTCYEGSEPENLDSCCVDSFYSSLSNSLRALEEASKGKIPQKMWLCLKGGNATLPIALSEKLKNKVQYGFTLTGVRQQQHNTILIFNGNQEILCDIVVLSIPCSVLKEVTFSPDSLPPDRLKDIIDLQYGTNAKILIPLRLKNKEYESVFSSRFVTWLNENDTIMTLYTGGQQGLLNLDEARIFWRQAIPLIKRAYGTLGLNSYSMGEAQDQQLYSYENLVYKSWANDPYAKGSYSNRGVGKGRLLDEMIEIQGELVRKIFRPVKNRIFFAGEHTTTLPLLGTLEGAVESGERIARLISKSLYSFSSLP